ncbi:MAG: hypothetical protein JWO86_5278 [Myxococcaceae bacterium]|nr:hypothetical protein [Myxococcaceae bacterium]
MSRPSYEIDSPLFAGVRMFSRDLVAYFGIKQRLDTLAAIVDRMTPSIRAAGPFR